MAKYNRDFLVPYLENLCALLMAERKLEFRIRDERYRYEDCNVQRTVSRPSDFNTYELETIGSMGVFGIILVCMGLYVLVFDIFNGFFTGSTFLVSMFGVGFGGFCFYNGYQKRLEEKARNESKHAQYEEKLRQY